MEEGESLLINEDGLILFRSRGGVRVISKRRFNTIEIREAGLSHSDGVRDLSIRMRNVSRQGSSFVGVSVSGEVYAWGRLHYNAGGDACIAQFIHASSCDAPNVMLHSANDRGFVDGTT